MISMKVQKKESKQSGNPARSLILVTVCTCTAIAFAAGGRIADFNGKNKVYAASENRGKTFSSDADETDVKSEDILYFTQITAADIADNALTIPAYEAGMQIKLSGNINGVHTVVKTVAE